MPVEPPLFTLWYDFTKWLLGENREFPEEGPVHLCHTHRRTGPGHHRSDRGGPVQLTQEGSPAPPGPEDAATASAPAYVPRSRVSGPRGIRICVPQTGRGGQDGRRVAKGPGAAKAVKRVGNLFERAVNFHCLLWSAQRAARGKKENRRVARFLENVEGRGPDAGRGTRLRKVPAAALPHLHGVRPPSSA